MLTLQPGVVYPPPAFWRTLNFAPSYLWFDVSNATASIPGATVTSWWRSKEHNARVGGAARSQHLIGTAVDVWAPDRRVYEQIKGNLRWAQYVLDEGDHLHVQLWRKDTPGLLAMIDWLAA